MRQGAGYLAYSVRRGHGDSSASTFPTGSSYAYIRRTSDRLCRENGLSVVKPGRDKGKSYAEWDAQRKGKSWKAKLKTAIDAAIPQAKDFDDFLRLMEAQGYEIKQGKLISFRAPGQERFTRCKTLGEDYTEEAITRRIKGLAVDRGPKRKARQRESPCGLIWRTASRPSRARAMRGGRKLHNLKQAARSAELPDGTPALTSYAALWRARMAEISAANDEAAAALKAVERRLCGHGGADKGHFHLPADCGPWRWNTRKAKDKAAYPAGA